MHPYIKFAKYVLRVHKSASNLGVLGDLGLFPLSINALKSSVEYWLHILKANECNLIVKAYSNNLLVKDSLCNKLKTFLLLIGFGHLWENQGTFSKQNTLSAIYLKLQDRYSSFWSKKLLNDERASGGNKLRTYRTFKNNFLREQYLYADVDKFELADFIKIRISNCNLNIERGRYLNLSVEKRICNLCHNGVEDEFHFLMKCNVLNEARNLFFKNIIDIVPSFISFSDEDKFKFILTSHDLDICKVLISGVSKLYYINQTFKQNL